MPFSADQMYRLVNNIAEYPEFLPACRHTVVHEASEEEILATIELQKGPVKLSFTTRNRLDPGREIDMRLERGPFRHFEGVWSFKPLTEEASRVALDLEYEFANPILKATAGKVFAVVAESLVDAFCQRAREVYGK